MNTFKVKGEKTMNIKELKKEIASFFDEYAELREKARKLMQRSGDGE
jgi:hypothetical protein